MSSYRSYSFPSAPSYYLIHAPQYQTLPQTFTVVVQAPTNNLFSVSGSSRNESIKRLEEFSLLHDGWDGYGAYAPSKTVCDHAVQLINHLALGFPNVPSPEIMPSSNGTVLFTWEGQNSEAVLEIGEANFSGFIRRSGNLAPLSGDATLLGPRELSAIEGYLG
jgi:hypothetical protein